MLDEATFRRESDNALETLKQALIAAEDDSGSFEFEDNNGVMNIIFANGSSKFVVTPNTPVRQVQTGVVRRRPRIRLAEDGRSAYPPHGATAARAPRRFLHHSAVTCAQFTVFQARAFR
jgi:CyaY protein